MFWPSPIRFSISPPGSPACHVHFRFRRAVAEREIRPVLALRAAFSTRTFPTVLRTARTVPRARSTACLASSCRSSVLRRNSSRIWSMRAARSSSWSRVTAIATFYAAFVSASGMQNDRWLRRGAAQGVRGGRKECRSPTGTRTVRLFQQNPRPADFLVAERAEEIGHDAVHQLEVRGQCRRVLLCVVQNFFAA